MTLCKLFHWTLNATREYQSFIVHVVSRCVSCHVCTFCFGQTFLRHVSLVSAHAAETHLKQVNAPQHFNTKLAVYVRLEPSREKSQNGVFFFFLSVML